MYIKLLKPEKVSTPTPEKMKKKKAEFTLAAMYFFLLFYIQNPFSFKKTFHFHV